MSKKPLIGITIDYDPAKENEVAGKYFIRELYSQAVGRAGGVPLLLPYEKDYIEEYLDLIDGLVLIGGLDIDPKYYGEDIRYPSVEINPTRNDFEMALAKSALKRNMPILGICAGHQLINVIMGGTLLQDITSDVPGALKHQQKPLPYNQPSHRITIKKGTLLHYITGVTELEVNSSHHQAIKDIAKDLIASAHAPDDIIEAFESPRHNFCLGVQWHPEYSSNREDIRIFAAFVEACREKS